MLRPFAYSGPAIQLSLQASEKSIIALSPWFQYKLALLS